MSSQWLDKEEIGTESRHGFLLANFECESGKENTLTSPGALVLFSLSVSLRSPAFCFCQVQEPRDYLKQSKRRYFYFYLLSE